MPNPAATLSASTGLSALLGGTVSAGTGTSAVAVNGDQSIDFSSLLSGNTAFAAAKAPSARLSVSAASTDAQDEGDTAEASTPASGKGLPLAALTAAVLPVPITLSALVDKPAAPDTTQGTTPDTVPGAVLDTPSAAMLMAAQHATMVTPTAPPATVNTPAPATHDASVKATASKAYLASAATMARTSLPPSSPLLAQPGFTLISDDGAADGHAAKTADAMMAGATLAANTPAANTPAANTGTTASDGTVTLSTDAAVAMADPSFLQTAQNQPGFTLLDDSAANGVAGDGVAGAISLADAASPVTLKADTQIAMADASYLPGISARPGFTLMGQGAAEATTGAAAASAAKAPTLPPVTSDSPTPGFSTMQLAQATSPQASDQTAPTAAPAPNVKLASARTGQVQGASRAATRNTAQSADTASTHDGSDPAPLHSPPSQSADGASATDNASNPVLTLASAGTTATAQTLAASGGAANPAALVSTAMATTAQQPASAPTDMAALVDRLVEVRAAARSGLGAQSTMASISHADFGRVSLRFEQDDTGMNISMTSRDPGFAPAAQAALAQNPAVAASTQGHGAGQSGSQQNSGQQPGQQWTQAGFQGGGASSGQSNTNTGGQGWNQGGQNGASQNRHNPVLQAQTSSSSSGDAGAARRRGGILA